MKEKLRNRGELAIREIVHEWKPVKWATYDGDKPDMEPDDPDYNIAKSMLESELDSEVHSIAKQLEKMKTPNDIARVLLKTFKPLDESLTLESCDNAAAKLYEKLIALGVLS